MPRLRRIDCSRPGIARRGRGRGFEYLDPEGARIEDAETIDRIRALVIPPAWKDVWISPHPFGHIQAVGTDAAGRKQYLYHVKWREQRDREKFDEMLSFAAALPRVREAAARHLAHDGPTPERVLACAVRLLDRGFFRIGSEDYAEDNGTYGLATLEKRHVELGADWLLTFDYPSKGGKRRIQSLVDPAVYEVVAELKRRRAGGSGLLAYRDGRRWRDVHSSEINEYVKELAGGDFSAKDFRTWSATVIAAVALAVSGGAATPTARKRAMRRAVDEVAHYLGNTPAVCRASYIDPRVFDRYQAGATVAGALGQLGAGDALGEPSIQGAVEEAVLDLLAGSESPPLERAA